MEIIEREELEDKYMPDAIDDSVIEQVNKKMIESIKQSVDCTIDVSNMNYRKVDNLASIIRDAGYQCTVVNSGNRNKNIVIRMIYNGLG